MGEAVQLASDRARQAAEALVRAGDAIGRLAPATDPAVPDIPEDRFDLRQGILDFEEARAGFARRFADGLHAAGSRISGVVLAAEAADRAPVPYPVAPPAGRPRSV